MVDRQHATQERIPYLEAFAAQPRQLDKAAVFVADRLAAGSFDVWRAPQSVLLAGIGASHAALAAPVHALRARGVVAQRTSCGELPAHRKTQPARLADLYVGVSQSGRSRETVQTLLDVEREARAGVANYADSPLGDVCDALLSFGDLPDSGVSTIGFTGTLLALGMAVERWTEGAVGAGWSGLGDQVEAVMEEAEPVVDAFAEQVVGVRAVDVVGGGPSATAAEEGALLLREGVRYPAMGMETRSYLHGPMDSAGDTAHVVLGRERERLLIDQLAERTDNLLFITDRDVSTSAGRVIRLPEVSACRRAILEIVVLQLLLRSTARLLSADIDASVFRRLDTKIDAVRELSA
ncbi:SIS domain-containing protein [Actinoallomurus soli]|uniref:SIS domain-containing protein n=1 Tax=Actinoallomurus soli TaxID=2952535 RepID=UPI0020937021|nr:hypothetical protein [Actinoallomurus soli]MCO5968089.1 hypothetical protein [Actinoallomurus soli]